MKNYFASIHEQISATPFIDTHEHLIDESERLACLKPFIQCDDWTNLLGLYSTLDLVSAGMSENEMKALTSQEYDPLKKWKLIQPFWNKVKFTGYGQAVRYTLEELYEIPDFEEKVIPALQERYIAYRKKGFYSDTLQKANIKSCVVNAPGRPFKETEMPGLLHQDINANAMIRMDINLLNENILQQIKTLDDWLEIIKWWYEKYADRAAGVKIGLAYFRRLDFKRTTIEAASPVFSEKMRGKLLSDTDEKILQDYLFWYVLDLATTYKLPVKFHTGHQSMNNMMNLENVMYNPSDCANLCRMSPETTFIFFHISYPYYEPMISLTKHYSNALIDMCWLWTLNPLASIDFLKKYIMASPVNKIMAFGGDDLFIENVTGHAKLARKGISIALAELVKDKWISEADAKYIAERIMWKNAGEIYHLD